MMTKAEARALCNELKAKGMKATVQRGTTCVRVYLNGEWLLFEDRAAVLAYSKAQQKRLQEWMEKHMPSESARPRSPLEILIDRACGVEDSR